MREAVEFENREKAGWADCFTWDRKQIYRTILSKHSTRILLCCPD